MYSEPLNYEALLAQITKLQQATFQASLKMDKKSFEAAHQDFINYLSNNGISVCNVIAIPERSA